MRQCPASCRHVLPAKHTASAHGARRLRDQSGLPVRRPQVCFARAHLATVAERCNRAIRLLIAIFRPPFCPATGGGRGKGRDCPHYGGTGGMGQIGRINSIAAESLGACGPSMLSEPGRTLSVSEFFESSSCWSGPVLDGQTWCQAVPSCHDRAGCVVHRHAWHPRVSWSCNSVLQLLSVREKNGVLRSGNRSTQGDTDLSDEILLWRSVLAMHIRD